jgi:hypothetical protein
VALSVVALLGTAPAAFALDAQDFAHKLLGIYTQSLPADDQVSFDNSSVSGNDITYDGLTFTAPESGEAPQKLPVHLTFKGVMAQPDGGYTADSFTIPDIDYPVEGGEVAVKNIILKHIYVPSGTTPSVLDSSRLFGEASVGPIVVSMDGAPAFTVDSLSVTNAFKPGQGDANLAEIDSNGSTAGMKFDMSGTKDQDALAQAKALDLETVTGKIAESGTWTLADGHLAISEISIDFDKVGKLKFAIDMSGYTPAFLQNLNAVLQSMEKPNAGGQNSQAATAMMLASLQTLFLNGISLRYDDNSITGKLLDFAAKQQGVTRDALIAQLVASLPAQMDSGGSDPTPPAVMKTMQAAVRAFLTDPHSIEVKLAPATPLGVLGIVAAAMQPDNLVQQVGLKVLVNDKEITDADASKETGMAPPGSDTSGSSSDDSDQSGSSSDDDSSGD